MNKLYKCALGLLTTFVLSFTCFSSADEIQTVTLQPGATWTKSLNSQQSYSSANSRGNILCLQTRNDEEGTSSCTSVSITFQDGTTVTGNPYMGNDSTNQKMFCTIGGVGTFSVRNTSNATCNYHIIRFDWTQLIDTLTCQTEYNLIPVEDVDQEYCESNNLCSIMSSLECQTEYNLIPISEVTANYCRLNFDLIDPQECPINSGTGAIVRSNLMINDIPYAQNQNINVFIPDFLAWNIAFNDFNTVIEVEGYNADEEYIDNIINQEKLTPTNKDIEDMLTGFMTNYFPYLALAIVFLYLARKIFKLFK